jgi:hypothetical protein
VRLERAAVRFRDRAAHREPEAHAGGLARGERLEHGFTARGRDPRPVVRDHDARAPRVLRRDRHFDPAARGRLDGVDRIRDQVAQHELYLQAVDVQGGKLGVGAHFQRDAPLADHALTDAAHRGE